MASDHDLAAHVPLRSIAAAPSTTPPPRGRSRRARRGPRCPPRSTPAGSPRRSRCPRAARRPALVQRSRNASASSARRQRRERHERPHRLGAHDGLGIDPRRLEQRRPCSLGVLLDPAPRVRRQAARAARDAHRSERFGPARRGGARRSRAHRPDRRRARARGDRRLPSVVGHSCATSGRARTSRCARTSPPPGRSPRGGTQGGGEELRVVVARGRGPGRSRRRAAGAARREPRRRDRHRARALLAARDREGLARPQQHAIAGSPARATAIILEALRDAAKDDDATSASPRSRASPSPGDRARPIKTLEAIAAPPPDRRAAAAARDARPRHRRRSAHSGLDRAGPPAPDPRPSRPRPPPSPPWALAARAAPSSRTPTRRPHGAGCTFLVSPPRDLAWIAGGATRRWRRGVPPYCRAVRSRLPRAAALVSKLPVESRPHAQAPLLSRLPSPQRSPSARPAASSRPSPTGRSPPRARPPPPSTPSATTSSRAAPRRRGSCSSRACTCSRRTTPTRSSSSPRRGSATASASSRTRWRRAEDAGDDDLADYQRKRARMAYDRAVFYGLQLLAQTDRRLRGGQEEPSDAHEVAERQLHEPGRRADLFWTGYGGWRAST